MKENKYDDPLFFEQYSRMNRSTQGLAGAGEWHQFRRMLPPLSGRRVLDLGCGFGWHCSYAAEQGAAYVLGTDLSERMLAVAREKNAAPQVEYRQMAIEDLDLPEGSFDIVLSSLAFHYVADFDLVCRTAYRLLTGNGHFVFSVEHPVFTASGKQDWHRNDDGEAIHWPVDRYFSEGARTAVFLGEQVTKYHRTLTTYVQNLTAAGFSLTALEEPRPDPAMLDQPGMLDELRRPMMPLISARK